MNYVYYIHTSFCINCVSCKFTTNNNCGQKNGRRKTCYRVSTSISNRDYVCVHESCNECYTYTCHMAKIIRIPVISVSQHHKYGWMSCINLYYTSICGQSYEISLWFMISTNLNGMEYLLRTLPNILEMLQTMAAWKKCVLLIWPQATILIFSTETFFPCNSKMMVFQRDVSFFFLLKIALNWRKRRKLCPIIKYLFGYIRIWLTINSDKILWIWRSKFKSKNEFPFACWTFWSIPLLLLHIFYWIWNIYIKIDFSTFYRNLKIFLHWYESTGDVDM